MPLQVRGHALRINQLQCEVWQSRIFSLSGTESKTPAMCESEKHVMTKKFLVVNKVGNHHTSSFSRAGFLWDEKLLLGCSVSCVWCFMWQAPRTALWVHVSHHLQIKPMRQSSHPLDEEIGSERLDNHREAQITKLGASTDEIWIWR